MPEEVTARLDKLLAAVSSYRDALLVVMAVRLVRQVEVDLTVRTEGGRGASRRIGQILRELHIRAVDDAYQNIAKNSPLLARGNNAAFDWILSWSSTADLALVEAAYRCVTVSMAKTARRIAPLPEIRPAKLTFPAVMALFDELLRTPSGGAHEQYIVAACLEAIGGDSVRVVTKRMNASDFSSQVPADIEVFGVVGHEALEVTANDWETKIDQAKAAKERFDLPRVHIVGQVGRDAYRDIDRRLDSDISALDLRGLIAALVGLLSRARRETALRRLYDLLDQQLAAPDLANAYVSRLRERGLAE